MDTVAGHRSACGGTDRVPGVRRTELTSDSSGTSRSVTELGIAMDARSAVLRAERSVTVQLAPAADLVDRRGRRRSVMAPGGACRGCRRAGKRTVGGVQVLDAVGGIAAELLQGCG